MRKLIVPALFSALLSAGLLGAQAPNASAPATPAAAKPQVNPNPGQGGLAPGQLSSVTPTSPEDSAKRIQEDADRVSQMQAEAFGRQVGLTPAQVARVRPILEERQKKLRALVDSPEAPDTARRAKMLQVQEETEAKLRAVLTPDQKLKFDQMIAARQRMRERQQANVARRNRLRHPIPAMAPAAGAPADSGTPASGSSAPASPASTPAPQ